MLSSKTLNKAWKISTLRKTQLSLTSLVTLSSPNQLFKESTIATTQALLNNQAAVAVVAQEQLINDYLNFIINLLII